MLSPSRIITASLLLIMMYLSVSTADDADDYTMIDSVNHKTLLVAMGCFWCGEESFERYGPGVVEAVSGYAGGTNENPTYKNHPGHYEVVLVEYDPRKTSYYTLLEYTWRNIDPFNGYGQFCDRGPSYRPAIFYDSEDERVVAETVLEEVLEANPSWDANTLAVPILPRPKFWIAEDYHQNYYIKNPGNYGFYKRACRRTEVLKDIWGDDVYECYHDLTSSCFNGTVINEAGSVVNATVNLKNTGEIKAALLPTKWWTAIIVSIVILVLIGAGIFSACWYRRENAKKGNDLQKGAVVAIESDSATSKDEEKTTP